MMRTGLPSAFLKSNLTQPLPRCFGSLTILPLRTGEGNPSETASNSQSATSGLIWFTIAPGVNFPPDLNFLLAAREIIKSDSEINDLYNHTFHRLIELMVTEPATATRDARLLFVAKHLERIGDYVTDICELTVYMAEAAFIKHTT